MALIFKMQSAQQISNPKSELAEYPATSMRRPIQSIPQHKQLLFALHLFIDICLLSRPVSSNKLSYLNAEPFLVNLFSIVNSAEFIETNILQAQSTTLDKFIPLPPYLDGGSPRGTASLARKTSSQRVSQIPELLLLLSHPKETRDRFVVSKLKRRALMIYLPRR
jgi:hypothetical protein